MTAVLWTSAAAARATGGQNNRSWSATGVAIDSRQIERGDLFVALVGERFDGHDFVADAFARSATAAVVSRQPANVAGDRPLLTVPDTMTALTALGAAARARCSAKIVAITGSVGKTGTKEALRLALAAQGPTTATAGNLNNQIGVPLSLARMPEVSVTASRGSTASSRR